MPPLVIGLGTAGEALLDALLEYRAVRRAKPQVLRTGNDREGEEGIAGALARLKGAEFALLFAALGASDRPPRIAEQVNGLNIPLLLVGILPATRREQEETLSGAYHALEQLKEHVRAVLIVDNERIAHLPNYEEYYPSYNRYIASCLVDLLAVNAPAGSAAVSDGSSSLQLAEVLRLLSFEDGPGYVAVSRASELTKGLWGYILPVLRPKPLDLRTLLRVSFEKFSVADIPLGCEKSLSVLLVPEYYRRNRSVDREQVEEVLHAHAKECRLVVGTTKRNIASIMHCFTFKFDHLDRLRAIRRFADEGL